MQKPTLSKTPKVVIVLARCSRTRQLFGIRHEEKKPGLWMADWAFSLKEKTAQKEGYDQAHISGAFKIDAVYPGCPYCHTASLAKCTCGKILCWDGDAPSITCPWCGKTASLSGHVNSVSAGLDR